jgi:methylenetetrahydrofolate reductase (NADPH)
MEVPTFKGSTTLKPTNFFSGAAVSPFKGTESEQMGQYYKLKKKLESGAQFIVTQLGYDARKIHEVIQIMNHLGYGDVPAIGNIYLLPAGAARLMNRNGLPGCVVTKELLDTIVGESQADDKGLGKRIERGAKMYAMMKGMGFSGVHIGGHGMKYSQVEEILEMGEEYSANWQDHVAEFNFPQPNGWYYFDKDEETGLNTSTPVDRSTSRPAAGLGYSVFKTVHNMMFEQKGFLFGPMKMLARAVDGSSMEHLFEKVEHFMKVMSNDCMNCGDCALFDIAYLCPMSQCPKCQRNGPCGGSFEGWCEVYPNEKECIYVRAYPRLKSHGSEDNLGAYHVPPNNWDLRFTSSWLNFFCGRDHSAIRLGIEPPKKK